MRVAAVSINHHDEIRKSIKVRPDTRAWVRVMNSSTQRQKGRGVHLAGDSRESSPDGEEQGLTESSLNNRNLGSSSIQPSESTPVVNH